MSTSQPLSRRAFLQLTGAAISSAVLAPRSQGLDWQASSNASLGRITNSLRYRDKPGLSAKQLGWYMRDTVVTISEEATAESEWPHNQVWYLADDGWVHSGFVQPVRSDINEPILELPEEGFLAEVTVPVTQAWQDVGRLAYRFYYATTHWVDRAITDRQGTVWYRVLDDRYRVYYFVEAEHLRRVTAEELAPLSPDVADKRIEVDLAQQSLTAYENGTAVFGARIASGRPGVATPTGEFRVERKRPSRHMAASDGGGNGFDLPGVPWVSYFYWTGVALHGTYWHNDYGRPRSRGCVNLTPEDAKWLYRWSVPVVPVDEQYRRDANGTRIIVV